MPLAVYPVRVKTDGTGQKGRFNKIRVKFRQGLQSKIRMVIQKIYDAVFIFFRRKRTGRIDECSALFQERSGRFQNFLLTKGTG